MDLQYDHYYPWSPWIICLHLWTFKQPASLPFTNCACFRSENDVGIFPWHVKMFMSPGHVRRIPTHICPNIFVAQHISAHACMCQGANVWTHLRIYVQNVGMRAHVCVCVHEPNITNWRCRCHYHFSFPCFLCFKQLSSCNCRGHGGWIPIHANEATEICWRRVGAPTLVPAKNDHLFLPTYCCILLASKLH